MPTDPCFDASTYQRMFVGELPAAEMETVCAHLEKCERCLQVVRSFPNDTLVASLRSNPRGPANAVGTAFVRDLVQKVLKQGDRALPNFIMFACGGCGNKLKVKPELAGKKVKCPKCAQVVPVLAAATSRAGANLPDEKTRAPQDAPDNLEAATLLAANAPTAAPLSREDSNPANQPDAAHAAEEDRSLIDFLAPPEQPDEIGRLGSYRVLKVLGAGGMGVVFKAEDPGLQRLVAIKAMLPAIAASASAKQRFLREARAAAAIKHIHIVTIFQVGEDRGVPFLAMEFLKGEPLDDRLKREAILPLAETLRIGREMAEGMAAAHEEGLVHRDIKPANTWLEGKKAHVKILDFGLARSTADQAHLTQSGAIIGTPAYMSPEQGRGGKLDARCDLWSLGVMLYRMCTGEVPFKGDDTVAILMAVAMDHPPSPTEVNPEVQPGLSDLVMQLLEKDRAKRLASAHEVAEALRALEQEQQATLVTAAPRAKTRVTEKKPAAVTKAPGRAGSVRDRGKSRTPILLALAGGLIAAIIAGIVIYWPTPDGVIRIESDDPLVEVVFDKDGPTIKGADVQPIRLTPGKHGFVVKRGDFTFTTDNFEMSKGDKITLKIDLVKGKMQFLRNDKEFGAKSFPPPGDSQLAKNDPSAKSETPPLVELPKNMNKEDAPKEKTPPSSGPLTVTMVQKFEGHTGPVANAALSGDSKLVLTGSYDKTAILWDVASGNKIHTFQGHTDAVVGLALSGDSKLVLTGSNDKTAILWDAANGNKLKTFEGHARLVTSVALSGDGKLVLTASHDAKAAPAEAAAVEPVPVETTTEPTAATSISNDGIPATLNTPEFAVAWAEWLKFTEDRGIGLEAHDQARQLGLLAKLSPEAAIADIRKTMQDHPLKDRVPTASAMTRKARKAKAAKEPKAKKMSALDAAAKVLDEAGGSMTCQEMIEAMAKKGYWSSPGGQTPAATLYSAILRETNTKGNDARFTKTERGKFARA